MFYVLFMFLVVKDMLWNQCWVHLLLLSCNLSLEYNPIFVPSVCWLFFLTNSSSIIQTLDNREKPKKKKKDKKRRSSTLTFWISGSDSGLLVSKLISLREHYRQSILHVHGQCKFWSHKGVLNHLHAVAVKDWCSDKFHLVIRKILTQA